MKLDWILKPHLMVLPPVVLSFVAWSLPLGAGVRRGFTTREDLTWAAILALAAWYATIVTAAFAGFQVGQAVRPFRSIECVDDRDFYRWFTILALVGTLYAYWLAVHTDFHLILDAVRLHTFNDLRKTVPYSSGPATLRYASMVSGAIAIHRLVWLRQVTAVHVLNVAVLLASAALASRLSLVLAAVLALALAARSGRRRLTRRSVIVLLAVVFLALTAMNYTRNADFYSTRYHVRNPIVMNLYESLAYLGAPMQGSIGVVNHDSEFPPRLFDDVVTSMVSNALPTYVHASGGAAAAGASEYRDVVDVDPALSTNSAFAAMYPPMGLAAFGFIAVASFLAAVLAGHASAYRNAFYLVAAIVAYTFAELWRIFLMNFGVTHALVLAFLLLPALRALRHRSSAVSPLRPSTR